MPKKIVLSDTEQLKNIIWEFMHRINLLGGLPEDWIFVMEQCLQRAFIEQDEPEWEPEEGESYWYVDASGEIEQDWYKKSLTELDGKKFGNYFKTEAEALAARDAIKELLKK